MRIIIFTFLMVMFSLCGKENKGKAVALTEAKNVIAQQVAQGTAQLILDGKTYVYDNIDWEKTRIKYDGEDVRLTLRQERLPRIRFRFPDIHESLERQREFKIPDVLRGGESGGYFKSPITLSFQVYERPDEINPTGVVSFHKGTLTASFDDVRLKVEFEGEGRKAITDKPEYFPINGSMNLKIE